LFLDAETYVEKFFRSKNSPSPRTAAFTTSNIMISDYQNKFCKQSSRNHSGVDLSQIMGSVSVGSSYETVSGASKN